MVVQHNLTAINANRMLGITQGTLSSSTEKLSSGYKINRAADDAAGLSISEKMRKQIRGLDQASSNAEDGISAVQTAEGALQEVTDMLQRMNELAVQASNGTNSETDRQSIQDEIEQLTTEIDRVAETTKFNETYLLKGGKDTRVKTLNSYDAGLKGNMYDDGGATATFTTNLKVGDSVSIAGKEYNIISGKDDANEKISNIQQKIKDMTNGQEVTIEGTAYTAVGSGDTISFKAGTGTTYSIEELVGKVTDGANVEVNKGGKVIARDFANDDKNITVGQAIDKMKSALVQANSVGATVADAVVTASSQGAGTVQDITNGGTVETNQDDIVVYDKTDNTVKTLIKGTDLTAYANDTTRYAIYKKVTTPTLDKDKKFVNDMLYMHTADTVNGAITVNKGTDVQTATQASPYENTGATKADYQAYELADLNEIGKFTNATHSASAKITAPAGVAGAKMSITFEKVTSQEMADGQNALTKGIAGINYTQHLANDKGVFSHNFGVGSKLDIDETGVVSYNGTKIATINVDTVGTAVGTGALALNGTAVDAEYAEGGDKQVFTIKKGTTEVKKDLSLALHVGADADMTNKITVGISSMDSKGLGVAGINVADDSGNSATYAIDAIENAIKTVSKQRSALGAVQNRLEHTIKNLDNVVENTTSAESQIRDTDMATEMVKYSNANILSQAGQSMLAQANQSNQGVLSLLG